MTNKYTPHKYVSLFFCFFFMVAFGVFAQVGIGNTNPNANALLEIGDATTTTQGLLLPRVDLVSTTSFAPMSAHLQGMVVYNKNTAGDVIPGYYYNDGGQWVRLAADAPNSDWSRNGNSGTTPGIGSGQNYIGTSDNKNLIIATNGADRIRIKNNGNVGIGNVNASERLHVNGNFRLEGAFMPGNVAGTTDKILLSQGSGTAPVWGPGFLNTTQITNIGKFYVPSFNILSGTSAIYTVTDPNMTIDSVVSCNFVGPLPVAGNISYGYNVTLFAEPRNGEVVFHIRNASNRDIINLQIQYIAYYH